jgi:hypothetical protein
VDRGADLVAHRGEEVGLGAGQRLGLFARPPRFGHVVEGDHDAHELAADVQHLLRRDRVPALADAGQHIARLAAQLHRLEVETREIGEPEVRLRPVIDRARQGILQEETRGGEVHVLDAPAVIHQQHRIVHAFEDGQILVLLVDERPVHREQLVVIESAQLAAPMGADPDLGPVEEAPQEAQPALAHRRGNPRLGGDIQIDIAIALEGADESLERDAAQAVAETGLDAIGGAGIGADICVIVDGGFGRLVVEHEDDGVCQPLDGRTPGLGQRRDEVAVAAGAGVGDNAFGQKGLARLQIVGKRAPFGRRDAHGRKFRTDRKGEEPLRLLGYHRPNSFQGA